MDDSIIYQPYDFLCPPFHKLANSISCFTSVTQRKISLFLTLIPRMAAHSCLPRTVLVYTCIPVSLFSKPSLTLQSIVIWMITWGLASPSHCFLTESGGKGVSFSLHGIAIDVHQGVLVFLAFILQLHKVFNPGRFEKKEKLIHGYMGKILVGHKALSRTSKTWIQNIKAQTTLKTPENNRSWRRNRRQLLPRKKKEEKVSRIPEIIKWYDYLGIINQREFMNMSLPVMIMLLF